ncbi:hypothetical protein LEP1GSC125_0839 [Leptospira mayottensis 200901122]|uniref:Uncharacterized protein n=1 Tax=Leptospira mayottensis 200901122 TaxID=1193010 RepID=A0AA87MT50_9LEPT|nr:hypothetical protein LEP1GSC125_0839 [Leptospira mayottensis 200901122]
MRVFSKIDSSIYNRKKFHFKFALNIKIRGRIFKNSYFVIGTDLLSPLFLRHSFPGLG